MQSASCIRTKSTVAISIAVVNLADIHCQDKILVKHAIKALVSVNATFTPTDSGEIRASSFMLNLNNLIDLRYLLCTLVVGGIRALSEEWADVPLFSRFVFGDILDRLTSGFSNAPFLFDPVGHLKSRIFPFPMSVIILDSTLKCWPQLSTFSNLQGI
ncbi:hypothetical protein I7I51_05193 [Histoplasma capsulatum]|uniref:Uncharacterized protein n=1 Tax=Ajellomyces capsulatus TaxID=5037 RepID=A0A8A1M449_AJECA|nr:hypothetical protein I7I51_05193 [Histoplasma capsulatum]